MRTAFALHTLVMCRALGVSVRARALPSSAVGSSVVMLRAERRSALLRLYLLPQPQQWSRLTLMKRGAES